MMIVKRHWAGFFPFSFLYLLAKAIGSGQWNTHGPSVDRPFVYKNKERKERKTREEQMLRLIPTLSFMSDGSLPPESADHPPTTAGALALLLRVYLFLFPDASSSPSSSSVVIVVICVVCWSTDFLRISYDSFQSITNGLHQGQRREEEEVFDASSLH